MVEQLTQSDDNESRGEHSGKLAAPMAYRSDFEMVLLNYLDLMPRRDRTGRRDGRRKAMRDALDGRATYSQIRDWRQGWRKAPEWAYQLLADKWTKRQAAIAQGLTSVRRLSRN